MKRPPIECRRFDCHVLIDNPGYCEKHKKEPFRGLAEIERGTSTERGYGFKWQRIRASELRAEPLCAECKEKGFSRPATVRDHINPHRGDPLLFWDPDNRQSLCKECHDKKTLRETRPLQMEGGYTQ